MVNGGPGYRIVSNNAAHLLGRRLHHAVAVAVSLSGLGFVSTRQLNTQVT